MHLNWVDAEYPHIALLNAFTCTEPERAQYRGLGSTFHPARWELEVQSVFRDMRPPLRDPDYLILGFAGDQLLAAVAYARDDEDVDWVIQAIARAQQYAGYAIGDEALGEVLRRIDAAALPGAVRTLIHKSNTPSQALFTRRNFVRAYDDVDPAYEVWVRL